MNHIYKVAENYFRIEAPEGMSPWENLEWHYEPFRADLAGGDLAVEISIIAGVPAEDLGEEVYADQEVEEGQMKLRVCRKADSWAFEMQQPFSEQPGGWVIISNDFKQAKIYVRVGEDKKSAWFAESNLTSGIMLAYLLATTERDTLMAHAASVLHDGKAYLFIAKSGTGKSTHARLWLKNFTDALLLNDDHPIVRIYPDRAVAYGSPWSGKTHCYKNLEAPVGAIVRIKRAPYDKITKLSPVLAYASLATSFSGLTFDAGLADAKHSNVERLIELVPCYTLECLPDDEAAIVCFNAVNN